MLSILKFRSKLHKFRWHQIALFLGNRGWGISSGATSGTLSILLRIFWEHTLSPIQIIRMLEKIWTNMKFIITSRKNILKSVKLSCSLRKLLKLLKAFANFTRLYRNKFWQFVISAGTLPSCASTLLSWSKWVIPSRCKFIDQWVEAIWKWSSISHPTWPWP